MTHELQAFAERKLDEAVALFKSSKGEKGWRELRVAMMRLQQVMCYMQNKAEMAEMADADEFIDSAILRMTTGSLTETWVGMLNQFDSKLEEADDAP